MGKVYAINGDISFKNFNVDILDGRVLSPWARENGRKTDVRFWWSSSRERASPEDSRSRSVRAGDDGLGIRIGCRGIAMP